MLVGSLVCAVALVTCGASSGNNRPAAAWTHYVNSRWGFCVDYPTPWKASPLTDGSGVTLYPPASTDPNRGPYISIGGLPDQPDIGNANIVLDDSPPLDLEGNFARTLETLHEYDHASEIRVLQKRKLQFQEYPALRTKFQYRTAPDGSQWLDESLWINKEYIIFTARIFGPPDEVRSLEPVYQEIVNHRFRLVCGTSK